jgi:pimeloyl-ACP methyl ester carboxylesterase
MLARIRSRLTKMTRPKLLLVSEFTELQWAIKPQLERWADVISYDAPGVGSEPLPSDVSHIGKLTRAHLVERGLEKIDEAGWERFFLLADAWGIADAVAIASARPDAVAGMALGHAALSYGREGERAPINAEVYEAFTQLVKQDAPSFVRYGIAQLTKGGVDEERAQRIVDRIPPDFMHEGWVALTADQQFDEALRALQCPLLLAKHEGCLLSTDEGFADAAAALAHAETASFDDPPAGSAEFAELVRPFCERYWPRQ